MDILALLGALGLVLLNGFFVATEFAIVKVRPTRIEELIRQNHAGASGVRVMIRNLDRYLSATQLGITLASLGLGWIGEPAFERLIARPLELAGVTDPSWRHNLTLGLTFVVISFLHITVGEMAPKSLAIRKPEPVAIRAVWPMRIFFTVTYPFVIALHWSANRILILGGLRPSTDANDYGHTEEEIKIILSQARSTGLLSSERADILRRAMSLPAKAARHLMVPRHEVVFLDVNLSLDENLERAKHAVHTRFPLCDRELDEVTGIIDVRLVLFAMREHPNDEVSLHDLCEPAVYFPETMTAERLLAEFRNRHIRMAIIVDEYGGASGIVTAADIVTTVMGELEEEDDDPELVPLPGGAYDVEGTAPLDEVAEALDTRLETEDMRTVAGFLMERLGRMPQAGDRVIEGGFSFEVIKVVGPRVRKVRIQREAHGKLRLASTEPAVAQRQQDS